MFKCVSSLHAYLFFSIFTLLQLVIIKKNRTWINPDVMAEDEETTSKGIQSPKSYESDKGNLY